MITITTTTILQAVLGGAPAATQPTYHVDYIDTADDAVGQSAGSLNSTTDVDIVSAPSSGDRLIRQIHIHNADSGSVTVTIKTDTSATERKLIVMTLTSGQSLIYNSHAGWFVQTITATGTYQPLDSDLTAIADAGAVDFGSFTSFEVPNGAGGTTVNATGEVCVDSTSKTLNFYDGAVEAVLQPIQSKAITVESPGAAEDLSMFFTDPAITVVKMVAVLVGSSTPSVTWTVRHHTDRNNAGNEVVTGGTTTTSTTTGSVVTSFNDATIVASSFVWLETTAQSGTVGQFHLTVFYRQDA